MVLFNTFQWDLLRSGQMPMVTKSGERFSILSWLDKLSNLRIFFETTDSQILLHFFCLTFSAVYPAPIFSCSMPWSLHALLGPTHNAIVDRWKEERSSPACHLCSTQHSHGVCVCCLPFTPTHRQADTLKVVRKTAKLTRKREEGKREITHSTDVEIVLFCTIK